MARWQRSAAEVAPVAIEAVTPLPQLAAPALLWRCVPFGAGVSAAAATADLESAVVVEATSAGSEMLANPALLMRRESRV